MIVFGLLARKKDGDKSPLVVEMAKFAKHAMISAAVCYGGKGRLHFIPDTAKVTSKLYRESLLPKLIELRNWFRRNCILSAGVFYFEPPCIT